MLTLLFSLPAVFLVYIPGMIFFLRFLMEYAGVSFYHPLSQFVFKVTAPFLKIFKNLRTGNVNIAALLNMVLISYALFCVFFMQGPFSPENMVKLFVLNLFFVIWMIMELLIILLIATAILSWIPSARNTNIYLVTLLKPLTGVFDRLIPSVGYISLSFIVVFLLMQFVDGQVMPKLMYVLFQKVL